MAAYTIPQIADTYRRAGFPEHAIPTMTSITMAESGGNPGAYSYNVRRGGVVRSVQKSQLLPGEHVLSTDAGLPQINSIHGLTDAQRLDPDYAARFAYKLSNGGTNFNPWSTYTQSQNSYKNYLPQVTSALGANSGGAAVPTNTFPATGARRPSALVGLQPAASIPPPPIGGLMQQYGGLVYPSLPDPTQAAPAVDPNSVLGRLNAAQHAAALAQVTPAQQQLPQLQGQQAAAGAYQGVINQSGLRPPDPSQYAPQPVNQGAYPTMQMPDIPTRPAPGSAPYANILAALGAAVAPGYGGQIMAAPLEAAQGVANQQYGDRQRAYEQQLQQATINQNEAVQGRQDAFREAAYNAQNANSQRDALTGAQGNFIHTAAPVAAEGALANTTLGALQGPGGLIGQEQGQNTAQGNLAAAQSGMQAGLQGFDMRRQQYDDVSKHIMQGVDATLTGYGHQMTAENTNAMRNLQFGHFTDQNSNAQDRNANTATYNDAKTQNMIASQAAKRAALNFGYAKLSASERDKKIDQDMAEKEMNFKANSQAQKDPTYKALFSEYMANVKSRDALLNAHAKLQGTSGVTYEQLMAHKQLIDASNHDLEIMRPMVLAAAHAAGTELPQGLGQTIAPPAPPVRSAPPSQSRYPTTAPPNAPVFQGK